MDVQGTKRVARAALRRLIDAARGVALRAIASERTIDQISAEHQSYFRKRRALVPTNRPAR